MENSSNFLNIPKINILDFLLVLSLNISNIIFLYISINLTSLNSKIFISVINKYSSSFWALYKDTIIIKPPKIIKLETPLRCKRVFTRTEKVKHVLIYHPKWLKILIELL